MRTCGASHFIAVIVPLENFVSVPSRLDWTGPARGRGGGNAAVLPQYSVSLLYLLEPFNFDIDMNNIWRKCLLGAINRLLII